MSSVINVRLNETMTLRFVELYRDQRLLWDKEHESYNKRAERLRGYQRIADGMNVEGLGVAEVASKIKNIRSTYLQELKKIKDSSQRHLVQSEEEDVAGPYVPKLVWFPIIDSMIGGAAVKRLYSSPSTAEIMSIDYAYEDVSEYSSFLDNNGGGSGVGGGGGGGGDTSTATACKRPSSDGFPASTTTKRSHHNSYEQQQSSTELFAKYMATSLETLPPKLALRAQKDMHDVLVKYKFMELEQDQQ